ncbi:MAG: helix-turn-helix domain-containing protein [Rikenellaceae bacterium]
MIGYLIEKVEKLENLLLNNQNVEKEETDRWFNVVELCDYLPTHPKEQTVYGWVNKKSIPFHKPKKRLLFLKSEIDSWIRKDRAKTINEIKAEAADYIKSLKKK